MKRTTLLTFALLTILMAFGQKKVKPQSTFIINPTDSKELILKKAAHVVPTPNQLDALQNEFTAFVHFGPNTFTRKEWGDGMEDPSIFDLKELDTDQWCQAMKAAGMQMVILTVKHHDGFVIWQSRYTEHGIMSTGFQDGQGDILKDLSASCKKYGLKLGIYLSPADLFQIEQPDGLYGNLSEYSLRTIPREVPGRPFENKTTFQFEVDDYNEYFLNQLFELLTEYGEVHELWFDGAHPKRKGGQTYNYPAWKELIRTLAPKAVIFGREDIRWCGNESGGTRDTEWNVVPYPSNPHTETQFPDMTSEDLGSREQLYKGAYLHYQPAETNTSIREGWFYRDDTHQRVRSADDVFDMYERAVGGNSILLLNIPPNREGKFSPTDVEVLEETGRRIRETYDTNLLQGAKGPKRVLDNNIKTYKLLKKKNKEIVVRLQSPQTINRIMLQEAIATHSERVEQHAVDAWINNQWVEIATATNIGYKRILRFPEVTTSRIRLRILEWRDTPAISHISAHYYHTRPPQLTITRNLEGVVSISTKQSDFAWKPHGLNASDNLSAGHEIFYTLDGSEPTRQSTLYTEPITVENQELKAVSYINEERGPVESQEIGWIKKGWSVLASSELQHHESNKAIDSQPNTYWQSTNNDEQHTLTIDLGKTQSIRAFIYTPQTVHHGLGMIEQGEIHISNDGQEWTQAETFEFGNLINDPSPRTHRFNQAITTRFVKIVSTRQANNSPSAIVAEIDFL